MKKLFLFFAACCIYSFFAAAQINVLSPRSGVWANRQMLVIEDFPQENGDYYYSLDGSEPESFGFAYDGPVLLDVSGEVNLKIAFIDKSGNSVKENINFSVNPDDADDTNYRNFVKSFYSSGILNYSSGSELSIPENLYYCFDNCFDDYLTGTVLRLSSENVITRYVPCTVYDKERDVKYRFMIKTYPQSAGIYTKREVPFFIEDWETVHFNNRDLLYKIDSEYWGLPDKPQVLDRSVSHMISWQSLNYEKGNLVEFYILPPKPQIHTKKNDDGSVVYYLDDSSYKLAVYSKENKGYLELFNQICIDSFAGEKISGSLDIGIFANSVYNGKINVDYKINKCPPASPKISSSAKSFYSRKKVRVEVNCDSTDELYIALSEPYLLERDDKIYSPLSDELKDVVLTDYKKAKSSKFVINWEPKSKQPVFYKLYAYAKNEDNVSKVAEYSVIIDQFNFYFNKNADAENAQGTLENPYTSFEQCYNELKNVRAITLRVKGDLEINKNYTIESNYEIINEGDAQIIFGKNASLVLKGSTLEINKCRISTDGAVNQNKTASLLRLENAVLTLNGCQIGVDFATNGTIVDSFNSIVNITDSIVSANAISYVSFISSVKSRLNIQKSSVTTSADVNVIISANEGNVSACENNFTVAGHSGRVAELFGVKAEFTNNKFTTLLTNGGEQLVPIYQDEKTVLTQDNNTVYGF